MISRPHSTGLPNDCDYEELVHASTQAVDDTSAIWLHIRTRVTLITLAMRKSDGYIWIYSKHSSYALCIRRCGSVRCFWWS